MVVSARKNCTLLRPGGVDVPFDVAAKSVVAVAL
jgi:hypothetical protein